jgi:hypothetical protein
MQGTRYAVVALIGTVLLVSGCKRDNVAARHEPVKIEETDEKGIMRVTLEARAAERIGVQTTRVSEEQVTSGGKTVTRTVVPYGALMYDTKGEAWTFTSPSPLVFVRQHIVVENIEGDRVILAEGPPPGTVVVTVGATELMGAEHKYGGH